MSKPDDWYPHYIADYAADTMHLTTLQHGAYRLLMDAYWRNQGPLPDDDEALAAITKLPLKDWRKMRPTMSRFFQIDFVAVTWTHKRIERELTKARHNSEQKARAGRASAEAKQQRKVNGDGNGNSTHVATAPPTEGERRDDGAATPHSSPLNAAPSGAASAAPTQTLARRAAAVADVLMAICETDQNRNPAWGAISAISGWLQAGADPDLDIFPTARTLMARRTASGKGPPGSPSYLTNAVMDAMRDRLSGGATPATPAVVADPAREAAAERFNAALDAWIAKGREGPKPELSDFMPTPEAVAA